MKIIIIFSILVFTLKFAEGQNSGVYSLTGLNDSIECYLYIYEDKTFHLELYEYLTPDILKSTIISYGHYTREKGKVILSDDFRNFRLVLNHQNKYLIVITGFKFMNNLKFVITDYDTNKKPDFKKIFVSKTMFQIERKIFLEKKIAINPLLTGNYVYQEDYILLFEKNHHFELKYKDLVLYKGLWKRVGNEIILTDTYLNYSFIALVDKRGLISNLILTDCLKKLFIYKNSPVELRL